jgi:hypothetical protein
MTQKDAFELQLLDGFAHHAGAFVSDESLHFLVEGIVEMSLDVFREFCFELFEFFQHRDYFLMNNLLFARASEVAVFTARKT